MTVTDVYAAGGLHLGGSADVEFVHGPQVDADIEVLWDFGLGLEDITEYLYEVETFTGRDWPSQLQGKAGPGRLSMRLDNRDNRFSYFNTSSPLNQDGRRLDPGATIRVQIAGTTDVDPIVLVRDRFPGVLVPITTDELGTPWEHQSANTFATLFGKATTPTEATESIMVIDTGVADYYVQATVSELGDNVVETVGLQELSRARLIYRWQDSLNYSYLQYGPFSNTGQHGISGVDVVAGVESTIFGPAAEVSRDNVSDGGIGDHRRRTTIGVHVDGSEANYYVNGCRITSTPETALQTDETHVGLSAYWGKLNRAVGFDEIAVYDRVPTSTEGVLWTGSVVDVFPDAIPGAPHTVTVTAEGTLAQLAAADIQPGAWAGRRKTGAAVGEAIELAGLLYPPGELAFGDTEAGSSTDAEINALTHVRKVEEVEAGFLHEAPEGWLVFRERSYRDALTTVATLSDAPGAQYGYERLELLQWRRELFNRITAGVSYGAPNLIVVGGITAAGTSSGVARTVTWTFPASVNDGDLFVLVIVSTIANNNENWLVPLWWVRERDTGASSSKRTQVYTHIAAASEASSTVTFYNDAAAAGGSFIVGYYQLRDWFGSHEGLEVGPFAIGESLAGADPEAILPSWGDTSATAYIAHRAGTSVGSAGAVANSVYPLGYAGGVDHFQNGTGSNIHDCGLQMAYKIAMSSVEDPSSFAGFTNLNNAETGVIAIRGRNGSPPEARGRLRVTVDDEDSQRKHNTVATYEATDLFPTEADAEDWCELMLSRHARLRPIVRLTFTATASGAYRALAYQRRLGDKVRLVANSDTGMGIDADMHIESIAHRLTNAGKLWRVTWELSPAG